MERRFRRMRDLLPVPAYSQADSHVLLIAQHSTLNPNAPVRLRKRDVGILTISAAIVTATIAAASKCNFGFSVTTDSIPTSNSQPTSQPLLNHVSEPIHVPTATATPQPTATPSPELLPTPQKDRLKNIMNMMLRAGSIAGEKSIFFDPILTDSERRAAFSVMQNKTARIEARERLWKDRIAQEKKLGFIFNPALQETCKQFGIHEEVLTTAWKVHEELAKTGTDSKQSVYRQLPIRLRVPPLFLAMIVQRETTGGIDFGNRFYKDVFSPDQITKLAKYLAHVKPFGLTIQWNINSLFASANGFLGIPQVAVNTLPLLMPDTDRKSENKVHKEDGSYLNIYDLFEGILAVNWILVHPDKGWNNNSKDSCLKASNGYGRNNNFEQLWNKSFEVNQMPLFIPNTK